VDELARLVALALVGTAVPGLLPVILGRLIGKAVRS